MVKPRGIRNNNPLNIRHGSQWQGLRKRQTDKDFCQFKDITYGYRAAFRLLFNYYHVYGIKTLRGIILRWAPPAENASDVYVETVRRYYAAYSGKALEADAILPPPARNRAVWCSIVRGMTAVECGSKWADDPCTPGDITKGYVLAFGHAQR